MYIPLSEITLCGYRMLLFWHAKQGGNLLRYIMILIMVKSLAILSCPIDKIITHVIHNYANHSHDLPKSYVDYNSGKNALYKFLPQFYAFYCRKIFRILISTDISVLRNFKIRTFAEEPSTSESFAPKRCVI